MSAPAPSDAPDTAPTAPPALPTMSDLSQCHIPVRKIFTDADIPNWIESQAYHRIEALIVRLSVAVDGKTVEEECFESEVSLGACARKARG